MHPFGVLNSLYFHDKPHFSRKDVNVIQTRIQCGVVEPLVAQLMEFSRDFSIEVRLKFAKFIADIRSNFTQCMTEQQLLSYLKSNDLYAEAQEFEIASQLDLVHKRGNPSYDVVSNSGVLMPLLFQFRKFLMFKI